jgi:ATP-binding cassette subfamily B multidrug efflux pump
MRRGPASDAARAAVAQNPKESMGRLLAYLRPYVLQLAAVAVLIVAFTLLDIAGPYLMSIVIDDNIMTGDPTGLARTIGLMVAAYVGMWLAGAGYGRIMASVAQKAMYALRRDLFGHMQTLSLVTYDRESAGDLMSRLTNDMDAINQLLSQNLVTFISNIVLMVGLLAIMFVMNAWLTLTALTVIPVTMVGVGLLMKQIGPAFRQLQSKLGQLNGLLEENLSSQRVIVAYNRQGESLDDFEVANEAARDAGIRANILAGLIPPLSMLLSTLDVVLVAGVGAWLAIRGVGGVTVGIIAAFTSYTRRFGHPIMQMANLFNMIVAALAGAERIFEVIDTRQVVTDRPDAIPLDEVRGEVIFDGVDFSYSPGVPVLKQVSLCAQPGDTVALVGPTGAGKTTIVNLLTRFYDIDHGTITVDGTDIRAVQQDSLRRQLGIVLQDTYLFADTVMENIRYGRLDATDEEVLAAAKLANADGFIRRLPEGYDTILSERASNLSQGQRQLLAIARAILADPSILILDEATSSVDTRTEVQIQEALLALMAGRTSFVIAHRLSTIRDARQILVINDGQIVERGNHEDLLAAKGFYYDLYVSQFKGKETIAVAN